MKVWIRRVAAALCLCLLFAASCALAEQSAPKAEEITKRCAYKVSEGAKGKLTDNNVRSAWTYERSNAYVGVKLPSGVEAGWVRIEWMFDPTGFELVEYDASMNPLRTRNQGDTFPNIYTVFELLPEAAYLQLKMTAKGQEVCSLRVYSRGELPASVQRWNPPVAKADLMVVSTHQDDELIFLGGTIPYYATALKKPTVVVYMANCTRYRRNEALNALWKMGVRDYPEFINLRDKRVGSINEGIELWGGKDNILSLVVERIRRFKPEVIVTQDLNGEYGHNQHKITARSMMYAIEAAADPSRYPESYAKYGAWQVKKLYHHLYKENQIEMDWETPLDSLNGYTPLKVAQIGMNEHASQLKYYSVKSHGKYDNSKFGLYFTTVGEDVAKNDFLEHIDPDASANYLAEHPEAATAAYAARSEPAAEPEADAPEEIDGAEGAEAVEPKAIEAADEAQAAAAEDGGETAPAEDAETGEAEAAENEAAGEARDEAPVSEIDEGADPGAEASDADDAPASGGIAEPRPANERGGGAGLAVALIVAGVVVVGAGGWYGWRLWSQGRRRRRGRARR